MICTAVFCNSPDPGMMHVTEETIAHHSQVPEEHRCAMSVWLRMYVQFLCLLIDCI